MAEKRYFWIQIEKDFFRNKEIKFFKNIAGGDTYAVIYLKMLLKSLDSDGKLYFDGFEKTFPEELALDIDESKNNVEFVVGYLISRGLLIEHNPEEYELTSFKSMVGSETTAAARMRRLRAKNGNSKKSPPKQVENNNADLEDKKGRELDENTVIDSSTLLSEFLDLFIKFSSKNRQKRAAATAEFIKLPSFQKEQAIVGAKNYIQSYKNENIDDQIGQYSVNAVNFLLNMMFMDYQNEVKEENGYDDDWGQ